MNLDKFEILNPKKDGLIEKNGTIRIATNCGWMWGKGNTCQNLLINPTPLTKASVDIALELSPIQNGEQIGIVLFINSDNYIKWVREMVDDKDVLVLAKEINGSPNVEMLLPFESALANLKLMLNEDKLTAFWSAPGETDQQEKSFPNWFPQQSVFKAGIIVHGNTVDNYATVHAFNLNGKPH